MIKYQVQKRSRRARSQYWQKKNDSVQKSNFTDINQGKTDHKMKSTKKIMQFLKISWSVKKNKVLVISNIYKKWKNLFQKKELTKKLSKHQSWNHEIKFISKMKFTFGFLNAFFETELKNLRNYLNKRLKKGIINKFTSKTKYPILFTSKKNGKLHLCVDCWKLNDIIIKNKYSLFNIKKLQNRFQKTIIFFKLDLRWKYNLVKIKN